MTETTFELLSLPWAAGSHALSLCLWLFVRVSRGVPCAHAARPTQKCGHVQKPRESVSSGRDARPAPGGEHRNGEP